jgi:hypothetical protein
MSYHDNQHYLSMRAPWQDEAGRVGRQGEVTFAAALRLHLPMHYEVDENPKKLQIYPDGKGIVPDTKIINNQTGKCLYVEKKTGNNGGNAHERAYKYCLNGIKRHTRRVDPTVVEEPFFLVFSGKTFECPSEQDKINRNLEGENYAIMDPEFANIEEVVEQIMEIL